MLFKVDSQVAPSPVSSWAQSLVYFVVLPLASFSVVEIARLLPWFERWSYTLHLFLRLLSKENLSIGRRSPRANLVIIFRAYLPMRKLSRILSFIVLFPTR
jgi:hypothetical protein